MTPHRPRCALAAPISDSFPGPKRALLSWTRRAFSNEHDTVCVLACDEDGLAAGVDELLAILGGKADARSLSHPVSLSRRKAWRQQRSGTARR